MERLYAVRLVGIHDLLMHNDDISWRDDMEQWAKDPENRRASKPGDDRTPAWRWLGAIYHDGTHIGIPADNLMTCLREGGAKVPTGKGAQTHKKSTQSGLLVNEILWPLRTGGAGGRLIEAPPILALRGEESFAVHEATVKEHGFELFVKGAKVERAKHIRVRPRFRHWTAEGSVTVFDETITQEVLQRILDAAGHYCGLGDWRPSSKSSPGPWGTFQADIRPL
jgi:hypothetical protein